VAKEIRITADLAQDDEGGYRASCPELDISARGDDMEGALNNLKKEIRKFFEGLEQQAQIH
jgi:predicted RNase H-like HicB family nuclease